jgi:hypothetical protein
VNYFEAMERRTSRQAPVACWDVVPFEVEEGIEVTEHQPTAVELMRFAREFALAGL